ncbi:GNAT family N-acetyltransferase [Georgenia faecalis]|uniref:GNAT family N-acetyltransferase n=1 Tax=Georgenia faecalis TaxID=2483799 RepID=UPI000FD73996|nr:GNAT family N-acetyltransferase [Georgenia faecalis]
MSATTPGLEVRRVTTQADLERAWEVRFDVFVGEQGVSATSEVDDADTAATTAHVIAVDADGTVLGTGRLLSDPAHPGEVHLGRLAVRAAARGLRVGARLVAALEAVAVAEHAVPQEGQADVLGVTVLLSAQETAMGFYERLGYAVVTGERVLDEGIWHQDMARHITL